MTTVDTRTDMRARILAGAADALGRLPLSKLTMDDVARSAGIARQTIYKHFSNKDDIVVGLFIEEIEARHRPALAALHAAQRSGEQLTEMFLLQLRLANEWLLLDRTFDPAIAPRVAELVLSSKALGDCNASLWRPMLADYRDAGLLHADLDLDQTVRWLTYQAVWFLSHPEALTTDPNERRDYIYTYITGALIPR